MLLTKVRNHPSVFLNYYMSTLLLPSAVSPFYKAIPVRLKGLLKNHLKNNQKKSRLCIISKNICIFALSYETTGKVVGVLRLAHEAEHHQSRYDCLSER